MMTDINTARVPVVQITEIGEAMADSRDVAAFFGKKHFHVLRTIRELQCPEDFKQSNFGAIKIKDLTGETTSHVMMTKDGFTFLAVVGKLRLGAELVGELLASMRARQLQKKDPGEGIAEVALCRSVH